jgi:hypothetical protein
MNILVGCVTFVDEQYGLRDDEIEPLLPRFSCSSLKQKSLIPDPIKQRNFPAEKANKEWWHSVLGLNTTSSPRFLSWNYNVFTCQTHQDILRAQRTFISLLPSE